MRGQQESWEDALRRWLRRLPCAETKRHVGNFLSVYRVRPSAEADGNSDDDGADEPFVLAPEQLPGALRTQLPAHSHRSGPAHNDDRAHRVEGSAASRRTVVDADVAGCVGAHATERVRRPVGRRSAQGSAGPPNQATRHGRAEGTGRRGADHA